MGESSQHNDQEPTLHTEPSFCIYSTDDDKFGEDVEMMKEKLESSATIGGSIEAEFSFGKNAIRMIEEDEDEDENHEEEEGRAYNRFKDLKIEIRGEHMSPPAKGDGGDESEPSKLRNYAQYLESTGDLPGAEEYYFRATQADPKNGETLSQYANLVWQLHGDQARASRYFGKAAAAAPQDSDVLAAYASFLWETDENEEEEGLSDDTQGDENPVLLDSSAAVFKEETRPSSPPLHLAMGLGVNSGGFGNFNDAVVYISRHPDEITNVEEYYRRMVDENPYNPVFLRNYALFLHQVKGDLQGAEEYYSRGILEDPHNGQMLSLYAGIVWQLHCDKDRAGAYFERAVEATPDDSNVLAAYAKFLWETESEEEIEEAHKRSN